MRIRRLFLVPLVFSVLCLTSCVQKIPKSYAALDGNWHIAGSGGFPALQYPDLSLAIDVNGNTIYAYGNVGVNCAGGGAAMGSSLSVIGQVAPDGTFLLTNSAFPLDSIQVTIQGTVPTKGATSWSGSYTIANAATETGCSFDVTNNFTATAYPPLDGTYSGTVTSIGLGSGVTMSAQITQGTERIIPATSSTLVRAFDIPLTSTITVSGSSCFTSGMAPQGNSTQSAVAQGTIDGDSFNLRYTMNDGSTLSISGWITDTSESTLSTEFIRVSGGNCNGAYGSATLTLQ